MTYNSSKTGAQVDEAVDDVQEAKAAGATNTTAGRLLKVGDFGVGLGNGATGLNLPDLNDSQTPAGQYRTLSSTLNIDSRPSGTTDSTIIRIDRFGLNGAVQTLYGAAVDRVWFRRSTALDTWQPWRELYHTGNIAFIRDSGNNPVTPQFPQGSVIERGANINGEYVRFADGTLICVHTVPSGVIDINTASGSLYQYGNIVWDFPIDFATGTVFVSGHKASSSGSNLNIMGIELVASPSVSSTTFRVYSTVTRLGVSFNIYMTAIGRWY